MRYLDVSRKRTTLTTRSTEGRTSAPADVRPEERAEFRMAVLKARSLSSAPGRDWLLDPFAAELRCLLEAYNLWAGLEGKTPRPEASASGSKKDSKPI